MNSELPGGVTSQLRSDGDNDYIFLMNFSGRAESILLDERGYTDVETGEQSGVEIDLAVNGVRILKRSAE